MSFFSHNSSFVSASIFQITNFVLLYVGMSGVSGVSGGVYVGGCTRSTSGTSASGKSLLDWLPPNEAFIVWTSLPQYFSVGSYFTSYDQLTFPLSSVVNCKSDCVLL